MVSIGIRIIRKPQVTESKQWAPEILFGRLRGTDDIGVSQRLRRSRTGRI
jgi:hypothetical protein